MMCTYVLLPQFNSVDQIKKNEMGGACSLYGGKESCIQDFGGGDLKEEDQLGRPRRRRKGLIKLDL